MTEEACAIEFSPDSIILDERCHTFLMEPDHIRLLMEPAQKMLIIMKCDALYQDAVKVDHYWEAGKKIRSVYRPRFTELIYKMQSWCPDENYIVTGSVLPCLGTKVAAFRLQEARNKENKVCSISEQTPAYCSGGFSVFHFQKGWDK